MAPQRKHEPTDWREGRRQRAWELHQHGWKQKDSAAALGVTQGAVSHWLKRGRAGGLAALRRRPAPGASPRLTAEQRTHLVNALAQGAPAFGFIGEIWTTKRSAAISKELFGVSYHPAHVSRIVRALGQSVQLPVTQATQRDEAAIQAWPNEHWPARKQRPKRKNGRLFG
jgi:transposase